MKYSIVIHKEQDSGYGVTFPDIPGYFSAGSSIEESIAMAQEAAECHIKGSFWIRSQPCVSPNESHQNNPNYKNGLWAIVEIDISKLSLKSKRINISLPERLVSAVDHFAKKHRKTRSGLLARAVTEYMATHQ